MNGDMADGRLQGGNEPQLERYATFREVVLCRLVDVMLSQASQLDALGPHRLPRASALSRKRSK
jgi:hypothetical protein